MIKRGRITKARGGQMNRAVNSTKVAPSEWQWFGCAAHLIVGAWCRFHLATKIGNYLVSTVGEYWPDRAVREIHARVHDPKWLAANRERKGDDFDSAYFIKFGYETIGCDRKYETMVFKTEDGECKCGCGLPLVSDFSELDFEPYNDAKAARAGHMMLCYKWSHPEEAPSDRERSEEHLVAPGSPKSCLVTSTPSSSTREGAAT